MPPSFATLTEEEQRALLMEASDAVLEEAANEPDGALGEALAAVIAHAGEDRFQDLLAEMTRRQRNLRALIRAQDGDAFAGIEAALRRALGVGRDDTDESLLAEQAATAPDTLIARALAMLRDGKKTDNDACGALWPRRRGKTDDATGRRRLQKRHSLPKEGAPRRSTRFITKALREANPGLTEELRRARDDFAALECRRRALQAVLATVGAHPSRRRGHRTLRSGENRARRHRFRRADRPHRLALPALRRGGLGALPARCRHQPYSRRRGAGYQPGAMGADRGADSRVFCRRGRRGPRAHAVRCRR